MEQSAKDAWDYARAVVAGDILSCKYLKLACKKPLVEYEIKQHDDDYPWMFHEPSADHLIQFSTLCKYPDGIVAGQNVCLHPWQLFVFTMAYGWRSKSDLTIPRFNDIYTRIARKNDKTTGIGVVIAYEMATGPDGHEEYITAVDRPQASIALRKVTQMVEKMDSSFSHIRKSYNKLINHKTKAFLDARSRENKGSDGASCYRGYWDEAARIEDEESFDIMHSSQGAWQGRHQNWYISTAQANRETRYYKDMEVGRRRLEGLEKVPYEFDRSLYAFYELDDEKEWDDEDMWIKSNPSIGLSIGIDELRKECYEVKVSPSKKSEFLRKKCNIYVAAENPWIDIDNWNKQKVDELERKGNAYIGIDMGKTSDLNAVTIIWANNELQKFETEAWAFLPRESLDKAPKHVINIYRQAIESGRLILTEGHSIDEDTIDKFVRELCSKYDVKEIAFDPYKSQAMMTKMSEDQLPMVQFRQGRISIGPSVAETEKIIMSDQIAHLGDPFFAWQLANCQVLIDKNDLPTLEKSKDRAMKIDNAIALVMAIGRATVHGGLLPPRRYRITQLGGSNEPNN